MPWEGRPEHGITGERRDGNEQKGTGLEDLDEKKLLEAVKTALSMMRSSENMLPPPRETYKYEEPTGQTDEYEVQEIISTVQQRFNSIIESLSPEDLRIIDKYAIRRAISIDDYVQLHAPFLDSRFVSLALSVRPYLAKQGKENLVDLVLKGLNIITLFDDIRKTRNLFLSKDKT